MRGTSVPKKVPANIFRYLTAFLFGGLSMRQPTVHGSVATRYDIMKISCQSWSSVDVTYVHPPQVSVRKRPTPTINLGSELFRPCRLVRTYHSATRANRGPDVIAMKIWKTERSGYRSPMVDETEGNHSCG
jgi:hypothetical protein